MYLPITYFRRQPNSTLIRAKPITSEHEVTEALSASSASISQSTAPQIPVGSTPAWDPSSFPEALSPAWDPSSRTPIPETSSSAPRQDARWLEDPALVGTRIQLKRRTGADIVLEFSKVEGGYAVVREGMQVDQRVPLDNLMAVRPTKVNDCVILLTGSEKGKLFKVKGFRDDGQCVIHRVGHRLLKNQTDPVHNIEDLARTYQHR